MSEAKRTTPAPESATRKVEQICPSWCSGHDDLYQSWEVHTDPSGMIRDHSSKSVSFGGLAVEITQVQDIMTGWRPARVWVYENNPDPDTHDLTAAEARAMAAALIDAADRIEREGDRR